ncbi:hypothetical protein V6N13_120091 [Hibiscus sabdariffa]
MVADMIATEIPPQCEAGPDVPSWRLEDRRVFTMKSAYDHLRSPTKADGLADPVSGEFVFTGWHNVNVAGLASEICYPLLVAVEEPLLSSYGGRVYASRGAVGSWESLTALGRGQVVEVLEFEASPAELLDLVDEEAASSAKPHTLSPFPQPRRYTVNLSGLISASGFPPRLYSSLSS